MTTRLDSNSEISSRLCFFRREFRRGLLRPPPLDFFLHKVVFVAVDLVGAVNPIELVVVVPSPSLDVAEAAVSFDIGVSWRFGLFRRDNRRRLLRPPPLDLFSTTTTTGSLFKPGSFGSVPYDNISRVVLPDPLDMAAVISFKISVISCWIT